jgi:hypothetical protein
VRSPWRPRSGGPQGPGRAGPDPDRRDDRGKKNREIPAARHTRATPSYIRLKGAEDGRNQGQTDTRPGTAGVVRTSPPMAFRPVPGFRRRAGGSFHPGNRGAARFEGPDDGRPSPRPGTHPHECPGIRSTLPLPHCRRWVGSSSPLPHRRDRARALGRTFPRRLHSSRDRGSCRHLVGRVKFRKSVFRSDPSAHPERYRFALGKKLAPDSRQLRFMIIRSAPDASSSPRATAPNRARRLRIRRAHDRIHVRSG